MRLSNVLIASLVPFTLGGCFAEGYSMKDRVTEAARKFNEGVRWSRYDEAVTYLPKEEQHAWVERMSELEDELDIADSEMMQLDVDKKHNKATTRMTYSWTLKRRGLVEKTNTEQTWVEKGGKWVMIHEIRLRGAPMVLWKERSEVKEDVVAEERESKWQGTTAGGPGPNSR